MILSIITVIWPFLSEAIEASWWYFFENLLMKLKCPNLLKLLGTIIQNWVKFGPHNFWMPPYKKVTLDIKVLTIVLLSAHCVRKLEVSSSPFLSLSPLLPFTSLWIYTLPLISVNGHLVKCPFHSSLTHSLTWWC